MANRHKRQSSVEHEKKLERAAGLKTGGAVKFNTGGFVKLKTGGKVPGLNTGGRLDKRARGGGVGKSPFSSAHIK